MDITPLTLQLCIIIMSREMIVFFSLTNAIPRFLLQELIDRLPEGSEKVDQTTELCAIVLQHTSADGIPEINQNMTDLESGWELLQTLVKDGQAVLDDCLLAWQLYEDTRSEISDWLLATEEQLKSLESEPLPLGEEVCKLSVSW